MSNPVQNQSEIEKRGAGARRTKKKGGSEGMGAVSSKRVTARLSLISRVKILLERAGSKRAPNPMDEGKGE